jgi:hypothetical protein
MGLGIGLVHTTEPISGIPLIQGTQRGDNNETPLHQP